MVSLDDTGTFMCWIYDFVLHADNVEYLLVFPSPYLGVSSHSACLPEQMTMKYQAVIKRV